MLHFQHPQAQPWLPEKIEALLWAWDYAQPDCIPWPESWPTIDSLDTVQRGGAYSFYVDSQHLDQIKAMIADSRPFSWGA